MATKIALERLPYQILVTILSFFGNRNIALTDYFRNFAAEIKTLRL